MKRYHVTTFGCQMNEHDSERMKGMLESLGYSEATARDEADLILFNTCSIREKADSRFVAHLGEAKRLKRDRPERDRRRRRLLGAVGQGGGVRAVPVRRRGLRPGSGPQARRVPDQRLAHRPGLLRVRGLHRPSARQAGARVPGLGADQRRLQLRVLVLHRAFDSRPRGQPAVRRARRRGRRRSPPTACARSRCSGRTSTRTGATCPRERRADVRRAARPRRRRRRDRRGSATRARIPRTCART